MQNWHKISFNVFRFIAVIEGITAVGLFFIAMPLKYMAGIPEPVAVVGLLHGYAFIAYVVVMVVALVGKRWSIIEWLRTFLASVIPLGTFFNDPFLKRKYAEL